MRRTRTWWTRLSPSERSLLVYLERQAHHPGANDGSLPEGMYDCGGCDRPTLGWGLCEACAQTVDKLIVRADQAFGEAGR